MADSGEPCCTDSLTSPRQDTERLEKHGPIVVIVATYGDEIPFRMTLKHHDSDSRRMVVKALLAYLTTLEPDTICSFVMSGDVAAVKSWAGCLLESAPPGPMVLSRDYPGWLYYMADPAHAQSVLNWIQRFAACPLNEPSG